MPPHRLTSIQNGMDATMTARCARLFLTIAAWPYALAIKIRNELFNRNLRTIERLPRPVISVGNLTVGGTGKTPFVLELARRLIEMHAPPAILLRGYKAAPHQPAGESDEAILMREALGSRAVVAADADRAKAAAAALHQQPTTRVFLLDDGFQHRRTHRDLDLVLIDATEPFGFGRLLPRGLLREPAKNLRRASAVIITHADQVDADALADLDDRIADITGQPPIAHVAHRWTALIDAAGAVRPLAELKTMTVAGVCGLGNPRPFMTTLTQTADQVVCREILPDHHAPTAAQLTDILQRAASQGAQAVVTTEKDWVKWLALLNHSSSPPTSPSAPPILRPVLTLHILDGEMAIHALLRKTAAGHRLAATTKPQSKT